MTRHRALSLGGIFLTFVIIGGGWFLGIAPQLAIQSKAQGDRANVLALNAKNQTLLNALKADYQNIDSLTNQLDLLRNSVPSSANISAFISELNSIAMSYNVTIKSIVVNDAKPYSLSLPVPATNGLKNPSPPVSNTRITSSNFDVIPVQITFTGNYASVLDFVNGIQSGQRLVLISTLSSAGSMETKDAPTSPTAPVHPKSSSVKVDASIGGYIYVLID
jgi:Tfp pilus assembly protein PilO